MWTRIWANPVFLLTATAIMWAANTVAGRLAVGHISPFTLTFLRWLIVLIVLWPLYGRDLLAHWDEVRPRLGRLVAMGALGFTAFNALYYVAAHHTSAINMGIMQGICPVLVFLGAFLVFGQRMSLLAMVGVAVSIFGVVVVVTKGSPEALLDLAFNPGDVAVLIASVLYAFYTLALKDRPAISGPTFFTLMALVAMVTSIPLVAYEAATGALAMPSVRGFAIAAWVAFFPSFLAQLFFLRGVDLIGPGRAGVYVNLVPVFAALLAVLVINERFGWYHGAALLLVTGGIWLTQRVTAQPAENKG